MKEFKIFIDTNILIYQTFEDYDTGKYNIVNTKLQQLNRDNCDLYISNQIIRKFFTGS